MSKRLVAALAVVLVMAVTVFGGFAVAGALSEPAGDPVVVGDALAVQPLSGWEATPTDGLGLSPGVRLTRGTANLDVIAPVPASDDPVSMLRAYVTDVLQPSAEQLEVSESIEQLTLPTGEAARVTYAGRFQGDPSRIEGEVTVAVAPDGTGVVFDAWGPENVFGYSLTDAERMVAGARFV